MTTITTIDQLEELYGTPRITATVKETDRITPQYRAMIDASPFAILATAGPEGLDCSPRGDLPGFVSIKDERTLLLPDRRGNNRVDSLRNIVRDNRIALLFMIPGSGNTLRVNGTALIETAPDLLGSFAVDGKVPRSVIVMTVSAVYFQCARAIVRSELWSPESQLLAVGLPTPGEILSNLSNGFAGGAAYDSEWPRRARKSLW